MMYQIENQVFGEEGGGGYKHVIDTVYFQLIKFI